VAQTLVSAAPRLISALGLSDSTSGGLPHRNPPHVTGRCVARVEVAGVLYQGTALAVPNRSEKAGLQPLFDGKTRTQPFCGAGAFTSQPPAQPAMLAQQIEIDQPVGIAFEDSLAGIAALGDMVWRINRHHACESGHDK